MVLLATLSDDLLRSSSPLRGRPELSSAKPDIPAENRLLVIEKEFLEVPIIEMTFTKNSFLNNFQGEQYSLAVFSFIFYIDNVFSLAIRKIMKKYFGIMMSLIGIFFFMGCKEKQSDNIPPKKPTIVVTYSVLGSVVKELAGDQFEVQVIIPNGLDIHEWEPSAKDAENILHASFIVENGLNLESGLSKTLAQARASGVKIFTASKYIQVRHVGEGEGIPSDDPDQKVGAEDPHLWLDPLAMRNISEELAKVLTQEFKVNLSDRSTLLSQKLTALDSSIRAQVASLPAENRKLVTGHESLGYFAKAYDFKLVGAIIPSITTQAEVSASELAELKSLIAANKVKVVFTEVGTPAKVAEALGQEAHVKVVEIHTHLLPQDGSYFTMLNDLSHTVIESLK
jgi:zinc/manganese transport system substrate-binding protein